MSRPYRGWTTPTPGTWKHGEYRAVRRPVKSGKARTWDLFYRDRRLMTIPSSGNGRAMDAVRACIKGATAHRLSLLAVA